MKIQYASDLHLEFPPNAEYLHGNKIIPAADILVLAGDVFLFSKDAGAVSVFDYLSENFREIYWLPGNHEYYNSDVMRHHLFRDNPVRHNIHIVTNEVITIGEVNLIFSTLWGRISPQNEMIVKSRISDFSRISFDDDDFRPGHFNRLHDECLKFITKELENHKNTRNIMITHHVPTLQEYPEQLSNDPMTEAFVVELHDLIEKYQPDAWIYGHSHFNAPEFRIGKTRMLTNQLGYVQRGEHKSFRFDAVIDI